MARRTGSSVEELRRLEQALRDIPIERFLERCFGANHGAFYDPREDLWIVPNRAHEGPGFAFTAIRSDRSWFGGVVPPGAFQ
ncbi:MAG: hypothetical protein NXH84_07400 [Rhodobacteraceae bacterium]|nr:hypothetical protein [Paracoccaceae bacterium]